MLPRGRPEVAGFPRLQSCTLAANEAVEAAAVYNNKGSVLLEESAFVGGHAYEYAGALLNDGGEVELDRNIDMNPDRFLSLDTEAERGAKLVRCGPVELDPELPESHIGHAPDNSSSLPRVSHTSTRTSKTRRPCTTASPRSRSWSGARPRPQRPRSSEP